MESTNNYTETDLGNVSPNPKGTYDNETAYEYLDLIEYQGGSYLCTIDFGTTIKGISPTAGQNSETWQLVALPGTSTEEYVAKHTEVIEKAKQVETSRAAVELCKQEVESAQADVEQMRQDTQQSAQSASDANTEAQQAVQQAEASRSAAQTSEQNAAASRDLANTYKEAAETAKSAAETAAQEAEQSKTAAETAAQQAAQSKTDIDNIKSDIEEAAKGENVSQIQKNMNDIGSLKQAISDLQGSGSGLNNAAKNILLDILKNAIYTTDQVNNINELGKALAGDVYSITNNLTHCTSSNTELSVAKGNSYTTTIIADPKYVIDSCSVTMKGIDITDSVYSNGKITINSVTGNVVITVVAEKGTDNLIKKSQCTSGKLGNGAIADGSTTFITPFIEVEPSTVYKHNITTTLSDGSKAYNQYIECYDANKTRLNTSQINTGGAAYESNTEYTNNASTHYIRILFNADHKNPYFGKSGEF